MRYGFLMLVAWAGYVLGNPIQGWLPLYTDDASEAFLERTYERLHGESMGVRVLINHLKSERHVPKLAKSSITERIYDCKNTTWAISRIEFYTGLNASGKLLGKSNVEPLKWNKFDEQSTANFVHHKVCKSLL